MERWAALEARMVMVALDWEEAEIVGVVEATEAVLVRGALLGLVAASRS